MILKFEKRNKFGYIFQKYLYVNMDKVICITVVRTAIHFTISGFAYVSVPRTLYNMNVLEKYLQTENK